MLKRTLAGILASTSALVFLGSVPAQAQQALEQTAGRQVAQAELGLEEIVVTARRREENVQSVPIAITAFSADTLQKNDIRNVTDLEKAVPGLALCCQSNAVGYAWLRGVPGVVGYFGEVASPLNGSALFFDVGNVQVLKGPQGTLFGISTNGGAILYQPNRPTNNVEGYVQAQIGDYGRRQIEAVLNAPVVEDKLLVRVGYSNNKLDGYIHDPVQNKDLGDEDYWIARGSITFRPTETIENYLTVNYYKSDTNNSPLGVLSAVNPAILGTSLDGLLALQKQLGYYAIPGTSTVGGTFYHNKQINLVDHLTWEITDNLTLKNIFGYVGSKTSQRNDMDSTPVPILDLNTIGTQPMPWAKEHNEEIQLQGKALDDKLTFTVGSFNRWTRNTPTTGGLTYITVFGTPSGTLTRDKSKTHALYGQGTYDLGVLLEGLSFTGGVRYSWDRRTQAVENYTAAGVRVANTTNSAKWKSPSYTLGLNYQVNPDTMLFITNSKGYSSGGFNATAPAQFRSFAPETLSNVEAGIKSDWDLGGIQARTNVSAFYGFYDDVQVSVTQTVNTPAGLQLATVTQNAATGHIQGIDAEASIIPFEGVELSGNITLVKAKYDTYMSRDPATGLPVDLSGTPFVYTPKRKWGVRGTYHLPIDPALGDVSISADYTRQSRVVATSRLVPRPQDYTPGNEKLNLSIDWRDIAGTEGLDGSVFVYNVTKNHWSNMQLGAYDTLGVLALGVAPPRMWGVRLRYAFQQ